MEFGIEKCAMLIRKSGKRQMTEGKELPNQERMRTQGEKETYKYLGILKADTIKQKEIRKKKLKKSSSEERKNYSKPNYKVETSSKW